MRVRFNHFLSIAMILTSTAFSETGRYPLHYSGQLQHWVKPQGSNELISLHSAKRSPKESFEYSALRYLKSLPFEDLPSTTSAMNSAKSWREFELFKIPEWKFGSLFMWGGYSFLRDVKFLPDPEVKGVMRRSSWMYPDDGCFARAALMSKNLLLSGYEPTAKIFAFGNLSVKSENAIGGQVSWWYHVVPAYRVKVTSKGEFSNERKDVAQPQLPLYDAVYVFDPAIEPKFPILIQEWISKMGIDLSVKPTTPGGGSGGFGFGPVPFPTGPGSNLESLKIAVCHPNTYVPTDECNTGNPNVDQRAFDDQAMFLKYERQRLIDLGRNPDVELGELPPWKVSR